MNQLKKVVIFSKLDFTKNHSMVVQDKAQSYHWASGHATGHPFVIFYKENSKVAHTTLLSYLCCLEHNTLLSSRFKTDWTFNYQIWNCAYTIFQMVAPLNIKITFQICATSKRTLKSEADWYFFANARSKGPCDDLGGTKKQLAAKASL